MLGESMNKKEILKIVTIDKHNLDHESSQQPKLVWEWGLEYAQAKADLAEAKALMERIYGKISLEVRAAPENFKLSKVTDKIVDAVILSQIEYQDVQHDYFLAIKTAEAHKQLLFALADKKEGIKNNMHLYEMNYWSEPKIKQTTKDAYSETKVEKHHDALKQSPRLKRRKLHGKKESK